MARPEAAVPDRAARRGRLLTTITAAILLALVALFVPSRAVRVVALGWMVLPALSLVYTSLAVRSIAVTRTTDVLRGQKREDIETTLLVENRFLLPLPYVTVRDTLGPLTARSTPRSVRALGASQTARVSHVFMGQKIGAYTLGPVEVGGYDLLGIFPWRRVFPAPCRVIVYPTVHTLALEHPRGLPAGQLASPSRIYEDVTQFRSLREYTAGDEIRRINWKATARMGKLFSTEFQPTLYYPAMILLNLSADDYPLRGRDQLVDRAAEVAASLVSMVAGLRQEVGIATTGAAGEAGPATEIRGGYAHALGLLETISCTPLTPGHGDYGRTISAARVSGGTRLLVVGPPPTETQMDALVAAQRRNLTVEQFEILPSDALSSPSRLRTYHVVEYGERLLRD